MTNSGNNNGGSDTSAGAIFAGVPGGASDTNNRKPGKIIIGSMDDAKLFVEAQYNPKELEITKGVPWSKVNEANRANQGSDQGQGIHMEFTGAEGRSLSVEMLFDSYEKPADAKKLVTDQITTLEKLASVRVPGSTKEDEKRPHRCLVVWGGVINMKCVIESLSVKYTMFSKGGEPLRATCNVKLKEADVVSTKAAGGGGRGGRGGRTGSTGTGGTGHGSGGAAPTGSGT